MMNSEAIEQVTAAIEQEMVRNDGPFTKAALPSIRRTIRGTVILMSEWFELGNERPPSGPLAQNDPTAEELND